MNNYIITEDGELYHYGVPGMKWGVRKKQYDYKTTSIRSALARRSNEKVDRGFDEWNENVKKRDTAIELGKQANAAKRAYEADRHNAALKSAYKDANKQYEKALSKNTAYRKGVVRQEVSRDISRKYLSEAKKVKKQLDNDPSNKELQKKYNDLMSKHDVERAKARRAADVGANRSKLKANLKRTMTMTAKAAAGTAAVAAGAYAVNRYLNSRNVTINGQRVQFGSQNVRDIVDIAKSARHILDYVYI